MSTSSTRRAIMVLIILQVVVLVSMPILAGPRIPSGTTVRLHAQMHSPPGFEKDMPNPEIWFDYGLGSLSVPRGGDPGDPVFVELRGNPDSTEVMEFGRVERDPSEFADKTIWIKLPTNSAHRVDAGPISSFYDPDQDRVSSLRTRLKSGDDANVVIALDNDGDPTVENVIAAE